MKRSIYDCWRCRHHDDENAYGIDICSVKETRCGFVCGCCEWFAPLLLLCLCLCVTGCRTTRYVPVVARSTDTLVSYSRVRDSVYLHDSTYIRSVGDTVFVDRWHTRWRERVRLDTVYVSKVDSVVKPYVVEKEKAVGRWRWVGALVVGVVLGILVFRVFKF